MPTTFIFKFLCLKFLLCSTEVPLDIYQEYVLKFTIIDDEYIVKISRDLVKQNTNDAFSFNLEYLYIIFENKGDYLQIHATSCIV